MLAGMFGGVAKLRFPIRFGGRDAVVIEQGLSLLIVLRAGSEIWPDLAGHGRRDVDFLLRIEKGGELVELLLGDGVELVIVALRATDGQSEPDGSKRPSAVEHLLIAELLRVGTAFAIGERVAIEPGGNQHVNGAVRHQIAGQLLNRELIERQIAVECVDHPLTVAPRPGTRAVLFIAVAIGVACEVEPIARPLFAIVGRIEEAIDQPFVCVGTVVAQERVDLFWGRRKAGEIEADAADEGGFGRFWRVSDTLFFQPRENESVNGVARPGAFRDRGERAEPLFGKTNAAVP